MSYSYSLGSQLRQDFVAEYEARFGGKWSGHKSESHKLAWFRLIDNLQPEMLPQLFRQIGDLHGAKLGGPTLETCKKAWRKLSPQAERRLAPCGLCNNHGLLSTPMRIEANSFGQYTYHFDVQGKLSWYAIPCRCERGRRYNERMKLPESLLCEVADLHRTIRRRAQVPQDDPPISFKEFMATHTPDSSRSPVQHLNDRLFFSIPEEDRGKDPYAELEREAIQQEAL